MNNVAVDIKDGTREGHQTLVVLILRIWRWLHGRLAHQGNSGLERQVMLHPGFPVVGARADAYQAERDR